MAAYRATLLFLILFAAAAPSLAADPDLLQDICVADRNSTIKVNGFVCKPAAEVTAGDFFFNGLATAKATNNTLGSVVTTANTINQGEIFVFPRGLVHFQKNNGDKPSAVISGFNSQLPGTQAIAAALFAASPPVPDNVLTKAFQIGTKEVDKIKSRFAPKS
ncbi:hypothetical protein HPP92_013496 [Vanilla planifolia]|uniref:Germin-like protein n=1 Tax=Vanilla planifolia TaxID=51239 RepID=A0A835QUU4_VANPL|nr:hypothetical protein HPP92_013496 [Vanilla planifolia]